MEMCHINESLTDASLSISISLVRWESTRESGNKARMTKDAGRRLKQIKRFVF